jgi:Domain of unknown function (DUF5916)/Carbohydrate family 9 binding domain-like
MKQLFFCILITLLFYAASSQSIRNANYQQEYQLRIAKATDAIKIDGELNEASWQNAHSIQNFWQIFPVDTGKAQRQTEVRMTYDANFLYVGVVNFDTSFYVIQSLKRDSDPEKSDGFGIVLDPVNGRTNGFLFTVNPYNVQAEDLLSAGAGDEEISFSWDNKWFSQTKRYPDHWAIEMAIPFKTLRYEAGKTIWGINFVRSDLKNNEYSTWTKIPVNLPFFDFGYTGALIWDAAPPAPGTNVSIIPYTTGGLHGDRENNEKSSGEFNAGFDAKIALSSQMNLDLTVNPDFSQVEVDQQVTNLTRFDIFFPEKRTFFLENADLFSSYGIPPIRPFYSRTIGLDKDGNRTPIYAGARLSGNLDKKTRIGILNMQTGKKGDFDAQNYTAVVVNRRILKRSLIKAYLLDHEAFMTDQKKKDRPLDRFGRNAGLEFTYNNSKGNWKAWGGFHQSWKYGIHNDDHYLNGGIGYSGRKFESFIDLDDVGTNFYTDMGFVQRMENYDAIRDTSIRLGFKQIFNSSKYSIFPKRGKINAHEISLETLRAWNFDGKFNERNSDLEYKINFKNSSTLEAGWSNQDINLVFPIGFTDNNNNDPLPIGEYKFSHCDLEYKSDTRKKFIFSAGFLAGDFYNGTIEQIKAGITFRAQPWGNFSVDFERDDIEFPAPYGRAALLLIAPRIEINFSNSLFWTTFIQYNTQENNININSRLQWRYKPMSDLFIVYTDNYFSDPLLKNRNRALVFKMNYWLNL